MSKDIRSFFAPIKSKTAGTSSNSKSDEKKDTKKRVFNISESDDEDEIVSKRHPKKAKTDKVTSGKTPSPKDKYKKEKKMIDVTSFFGESPVCQKPQTLIKIQGPDVVTPRPLKSDGRSKKSKKQPEVEVTLEDHFDDGFEDTLCMLDEEKLGITPKKIGYPSQVNEDAPEYTDKQLVKKVTPEKSGNELENVTTPAGVAQSDKRKSNAEAYQRYLSRSGPRNLGSKPIPEGAPDFLHGKSFVVSGVLESLERDEAIELIKKYGGRSSSSVSKKTSYILVGDEPGESKVKKAEQYKIPFLTEDGFLDLIRLSMNNQTHQERKSKYFSDLKTATVIASSKKLKFSNESAEKSTNASKSKITSLALSDSGNRMSTSTNKFTKSTNLNAREIEDSSRKVISNSMDSGFNSMDVDSELLRTMSSSDLPLMKTINVGDSLWVDKYKPKNTKGIIGQTGDKSNVKKLTKWLNEWHKHHGSLNKKKPQRPAPWNMGDDGAHFKAALLSGPPGVGKTTSVHLVCKELGFDIVEFNASDTRSKRLLSEQVAELLGSKSIRGFCSGSENDISKHVLVMDEVDGMAGNEDRGGIQELIQLIKKTRTPIVCMCNDRNHPKIRSLVNYCFDLRYNRPRVEQIKGAMMSICFKEGVQISGDALTDMITSSNQDVRQVLHNLSLWSIKDKNLADGQVKLDAAKARKSLKLGPWDVARQVFSQSEQEKTTFRQKEELFFQDYSLGPLFVQDTYIRVKPFKAKGDRVKTLECLAKAADNISLGDITERLIRSRNAWNLLPIQAIFSSVLPGHEMAGHVMGQITFPAWLGKNSKRNRMDRLLQELHVHTRLSTSGSKQSVNMDYSQPLRDSILRPLISEKLDGIPGAVKAMTDYHLLREDLDSLVELCQWPGKNDPFASIDSKIKAAFTRAFNKESAATPYAVTGSFKKTKHDEGELLEMAIEGEDDGGEDEEHEEVDDINADAMIKKGKPKKESAKKKESAGQNDDKKACSKSKSSASRKKNK